MNVGFGEIFKGFESELLGKAKSMDKISDYRDLDQPIAKLLDNSGVYDSSQGDSDKLKPNIKVEIDGDEYETDDNGDIYKKNNELLSDVQYEINGYKYKTDNNNRIISAEGVLHLKDRMGRLPIKDSIEDIGKGDQRENDDRGHLVGDQFDGSNGLENMVPQDAEINRNDFRYFENELAKEVKDGKEVYYKIEPIYNDNSKRPIVLVVTYNINGEENIKVFPNGKEV